jgi:hypothetical protein
MQKNIQNWRDRATDALAQAEQVSDAEFRRLLIDIAAGYERLARRAEEQLHKPRDVTNAN